MSEFSCRRSKERCGFCHDCVDPPNRHLDVARRYEFSPPKLVPQPMTFLVAVRSGHATLEDVDEWVDAWHNGAGADDQTLGDYLGLNDKQYAEWVRNPDAIKGFV